MAKVSKEQFYKKHNPKIQKVLANKKVGIIGAGGIGSNVAVSLARSGIGKLIIADFDNVEITNLNRQYYFINQIGKSKTKALLENLNNINPFVEYEVFNTKINGENINLFKDCHILVEAVDKAETKAEILSAWQTLYPNKTIILTSGIAGIGNNSEITCDKIDDFTYICGDKKSKITLESPPYAPKVAIVANMIANLVLELLLKEIS